MSEQLLANLLSPVGAGSLSSYVSQQEYSKLFERDRLGIFSSTEYFSGGNWHQAGSQYGTLGNFSYSLDADYLLDQGQRPNNDIDRLNLWARVKEQVTPHDSIYVEAQFQRIEAGDVRQLYDQSSGSPALRTKETQVPNLYAGYHHEWSPGVHTLFLAARLAGGVRHRHHEMRIQLQQRLDEARLARTARRGDDEEVSGVFHQMVYSRFCTCSRNCSMATFISTEILVSSRLDAFDPRVFASRSNS